MISTLPDLQVLLDDGSGMYGFDLTDRVRLASLAVSGHGRSDEFSEANAATFTVTLDNDDGALTSGTGFDELPFGFGGFGGVGGVFYIGQPIRYRVAVGATTASRFTGRLTSVELGWDAVTGLPSSVELTAVDPLGSLSRRVLRSMLEQEILSDSPSAYYTLGEPEGSTSAGDTSGNQTPVLAMTGTGAAVVFGSGTGPADGLTAATFAAGQWLSATLAAVPTTIEFWFATTTNDAIFRRILGDDIGLDNGTLWVSNGPRIDTGVTVADGLNHHVVWAGTNVHIDGTLATSAAHEPSTATLDVGGWSQQFQSAYSGTMAHVAAYTSALSPTRIAAHYQAGSTGFAGETTTARAARLASYAGLTVTTTTGMSGQTVGAQDLTGKSPLDAFREVATAEGGVLYADNEGIVVLQGRGYRAGKTTADLTISADYIDVGTTVPLDDQQVVNQVTVTREGGATQVYPSTPVDVELYQESLDLIVDNDGDALRAAQWLAGKHAEAAPRISSATVDLMRCPQTEQIIAAEIGDRWAIEDMPSQMWDVFGDQTVEGWSESLSTSGNTATWTLTVNLLPWSLETALVLDDPTFGALDSFPIRN